ncbi:hypothetical protein M434DRAFT_7650 [Hypoxylon sp. CO27-5]|nr:hypothetical protein M434DRAFT_7650 [Hypoxylon sp. CO27-5]
MNKRLRPVEESVMKVRETVKHSRTKWDAFEEKVKVLHKHIVKTIDDIKDHFDNVANDIKDNLTDINEEIWLRQHDEDGNRLPPNPRTSARLAQKAKEREKTRTRKDLSAMAIAPKKVAMLRMKIPSFCPPPNYEPPADVDEEADTRKARYHTRYKTDENVTR